LLIFQQHFKADRTSFEVDYGELIYTHESPFLWSIPRGLNIQTIENNMFIAPIYRQIYLTNDFLIIYNQKNGFYIRNFDRIYIIGQQCPLIEVPIPQSKRVNLLQRDLLQIYIYRLFLQSNEKPRRIRIDDIKRVFPRLAESSIRKRLKTSADFRRTGKNISLNILKNNFILFSDDCNSWILRDDFRLPTEDEIRDLIKPEFCCAYASMTAAEQRLKGTTDIEQHEFSRTDFRRAL
jgi:transcription initiation factor TFIID subunit 1